METTRFSLYCLRINLSITESTVFYITDFRIKAVTRQTFKVISATLTMYLLKIIKY